MAHYFRRQDASGQIDLVGVSAPFPEPEVQVPFLSQVEPMVPVWDGSRYYPGEEVEIAFGTRISHGRVDVVLPVASLDMVNALKALRDEAEPFHWSPDDGSTTWVVSYLPGDSLVCTPGAYLSGWFSPVVNRLKVHDRIEGSGS
ncbi:MAG: hypothetical protein AMXMBFR33_01410 [Candidatus Xenobia bacterium]